MAYKLTRLLVEDIIKLYWTGAYPLFNNEPLVCKKDDYRAWTIAGVVIHMKKAHDVYAIKSRGVKRKMYESKELLPQNEGRNWFIKLPEEAK